MALEVGCEWLSPPEIAKWLGVCAETVLSWIRSGELDAIKTTRHNAKKPRFKVRRKDLDSFLLRRSVVAPAPTAVRRPRPDKAVKQYV